MQTKDRIRKLEAEARALRRAEKAFWDEVDKRRPEVEDYLNRKRGCIVNDGGTIAGASQSTEPNEY